MKTRTTTTTQVNKTTFSIDLTATTPVDRPASDVWAVLADAGRYREWNPFVTEFVGELVPGERVSVSLQLAGAKAHHLKPRIISVDAGRSFTWQGGMGIRGLFDARHHVEVRDRGPESCELIQHERLSGVLVPMFRSTLTGPTPQAFVALNEACKARVEHAR